MNILFLKFFGENFKKIATENPLGINILSTNVKYIVNSTGNTVSLKHYNPNSLNKLLELSFTYTDAQNAIKPLIIKSVNSFKFIEPADKAQAYTKPNAAKLTELRIPTNIQTAINAAAGNLGTIAETPQKNPDMICLAVEFETTSAQINTGFTAATDIKITSNYWKFITMTSRMNYDATTSRMDYDEDNSIKIDFNEYSQKELNEFINEGIISEDQLNNYNASLSRNCKDTNLYNEYKTSLSTNCKDTNSCSLIFNFNHSTLVNKDNTSLSTNSKDTNLYSLRLNSIKSTLVIETKTETTDILKLGTYPTNGATEADAAILSNMLAPNLVKLNNNALTVKTINDTGAETAVNALEVQNQTDLQNAINTSLGITQDNEEDSDNTTDETDDNTDETDDNTDETDDNTDETDDNTEETDNNTDETDNTTDETDKK